jgi:hypothetical protein
VSFGGCRFSNLEFIDSSIAFSRFNQFENSTENENLVFKNCEIIKVHFMDTDLTKSSFFNCLITHSVYSNNIFSTHTFGPSNAINESQYSSVDLQTILNSPKIDAVILRKIFGILNDDIKEYISELTSEVKYQSIFISYCFKDREFAARLNHELRSGGVSTFLWEKDAPGGKPLKKIMKDGIQKHDRLLFIASSNSLKSKACQFELTEARKKTEELWESVLFPIHIDTFLFDVEKEQIRPIESQDEIWKNISELREINSIDFSNFVGTKVDSDEFKNSVRNLIKELRK